MGEIKSIGDKKEEIFNPPDSLRRCDLRQSPADPGFDSIPKYQREANDDRQNLETMSSLFSMSRYLDPLTQHASNVAVPVAVSIRPRTARNRDLPIFTSPSLGRGILMVKCRVCGA